MTKPKKKSTKAVAVKVEETVVNDVASVNSNEITEVSQPQETENVNDEVKGKEQEKKPKKEKEAKAIFYNRKSSGQFIKLEKSLSLEQLKQRDSLPSDVSLKDSEFLFEDGAIYNIGSQSFIQKDGKEILNNLK
jgi:archaellum component FlaD/FlaE